MSSNSLNPVRGTQVLNSKLEVSSPLVSEHYFRTSSSPATTSCRFPVLKLRSVRYSRNSWRVLWDPLTCGRRRHDCRRSPQRCVSFGRAHSHARTSHHACGINCLRSRTSTPRTHNVLGQYPHMVAITVTSTLSNSYFYLAVLIEKKSHHNFWWSDQIRVSHLSWIRDRIEQKCRLVESTKRIQD